MKRSAYYIVFVLIACFFSCTIESTTHFNRDYSGNSECALDSRQFKDFIGSMTGNDSENPMDSLFLLLSGDADMPDSAQMMLDSMKYMMTELGFKNFEFELTENDKFKTSFQFDDLDVFDPMKSAERSMELQAYEKEDISSLLGDKHLGSTMLHSASVSRDDHLLTIDFGSLTMEDLNSSMFGEDNATNDEEEKNEDSNNLMSGFGSMIRYEMKYTFDRKIKEVESSLPYEADKHSITLDFTFGELMEVIKEEKSALLKVELKESFFEKLF